MLEVWLQAGAPEQQQYALKSPAATKMIYDKPPSQFLTDGRNVWFKTFSILLRIPPPCTPAPPTHTFLLLLICYMYIHMWRWDINHWVLWINVWCWKTTSLCLQVWSSFVCEASSAGKWASCVSQRLGPENYVNSNSKWSYIHFCN